MKYLGIDYGRRKIGLAVSDGVIAEPLKVVRIKNIEDGIRKVSNVVSSFAKAIEDKSEDKQVELVDKAVIGVSEGKMAEETKAFGKRLENKLKIPVVFQDETLSTYSAQELAISANIKRKKRKEMEDAYSAAIILQSYIDSNL